MRAGFATRAGAPYLPRTMTHEGGPSPVPEKRLPGRSVVIGFGAAVFVVALGSLGAFYTGAASLKKTEPYQVAEAAADRDPQVIEATGGVVGHGRFPSGQIAMRKDGGTARFDLRVLGAKKDLDVLVKLQKPLDGPWRVVEIQRASSPMP